jgi:hypothetical protein
MNDHTALEEMYRQGKTEVLGEKILPVPLDAPQIPYEEAWD